MENKDGILFPLRKFHGSLHDKLVAAKHKINNWKYFSFPIGKKVYVIGTPEYKNLGDSAIAIAEMKFLESCGIPSNRIKEITVPEYNQDYEQLVKCIGCKNFICGIGGGNMGNQWYDEELFRYKFMEDLPHNPLVIFPQTIHYTDNDEGKTAEEKSIQIYNERYGLTLVAREEKSNEIMKTLYPKTDILLTPDIVLSATMETFGVTPHNRNGVLLCMRSDAEKTLTDEDRMYIEEYLKNNSYEYRKTDMYSDYDVNKYNRADCVRSKMNEFTKAELVITDRLHGMIFSAITGTPCVVFSNYNHKVSGTYKWISYLPYIKYVEDIKDVERYAPELISMKNCQFDNLPLKPYFDKFAEVVKSKC
ncbi:MAG: polysaccharide pyruvyl transferase family protein [Acutalibacteraceae bacterium]|nr:polysaccharide pyruvyl transferase family protein [Acutalibacteraceae bacterium]